MKEIINISIVIISCCIIIYLIYNQVSEYYKQTDPMITELKNKIRVIFPDIDNLKMFEGKKSYTINKQKVYICLKDENGKYYNINNLIYVTIHELSHVLNDEIGHTPKFYNIFEELLEEAAKKGIYDPTIQMPSDYCQY